ncbi:DUF4268 domain-containing protein [Portibacter lacus]|uniref:DUF4268 domain-containing protein n=1 Tax=Portibacter lacus TaxID=1099794 RepID=A0AA37WC15_9BACT|nr:DUF4268 domain-containing protein [Portibacter lacus]GLR16016.1 hypothetical protein GCM10007940_06310 [Portibacter lacus]
MKRIAHGNPIFISNGQTEILKTVNLFLEADIQNLIFENPECLPISDIDESYNPVIPVCKELNTGAGPLDIFMITPNGDLVIIETKLWSNPEARRKVVAQILDYAKELSAWTYADLQRELNRKLGTKGNILYDFSTRTEAENILSETDFVDAVSRNLRIGKFMLIIAGDGIREGAKNLTEFISKAGNLNFSLAMVELPVFKNQADELIIFPRTIVKTIEIQKINIEISEGTRFVSDDHEKLNDNDTDVSPEIRKRRDFFTSFWTEFIENLQLDDPECPLPNVTKSQNIYLYPGNDKNAWISAYFATSHGSVVGVYLRFANNQKGGQIKEELEVYKEEMLEELGPHVIWRWDKNAVDAFTIRMPLEEVYDPKNRDLIKRFFSEWINKFVNVIRPKLKEID